MKRKQNLGGETSWMAAIGMGEMNFQNFVRDH
jgi:hypothetical protein